MKVEKGEQAKTGNGRIGEPENQSVKHFLRFGLAEANSYPLINKEEGGYVDYR